MIKNEQQYEVSEYWATIFADAAQGLRAAADGPSCALAINAAAMDAKAAHLRQEMVQYRRSHAFLRATDFLGKLIYSGARK